MQSELFEGLDDDGCYTPEKYGARRSVKKLVIRPSPAASGGSSRITAGENRKGAFSSPSLYSNHNRSAVEMTNPLGAEETFDLSGVDKVKRYCTSCMCLLLANLNCFKHSVRIMFVPLTHLLPFIIAGPL